MTRKIEYVNNNTGEITDNHNTAVMEWYNNGDDVTVMCNGVARARWVH